MKRKILTIISCIVVLSSCMTSGPVNNVEFKNIQTITDLEGIYKNIGEGDSKSNPVYLSAVIWPSAEGLNHKSIELIEVRAINENTLSVKAYEKNNIKKEELFVKGKDFEITSGRIQLKRQAILSLAYPADNPFIGPLYGKDEIGLDERGHGKYRQSVAFAGTAFLFIPVAGAGTDDVRFIKITE